MIYYLEKVSFLTRYKGGQVFEVFWLAVVYEIFEYLVLTGEQTRRRVGLWDGRRRGQLLFLGAGRTVARGQNSDAAVLADSVTYLLRVYPYGELVWKYCEQLVRIQSTAETRFSDQWIHFVIYSDASVAATSEWLLWEPVILIMAVQHIAEVSVESVQLVRI